MKQLYQKINFSYNNRFILFLFVFTFFCSVAGSNLPFDVQQQQQILVEGRVVDENGIPMGGVNIIEKGTQNGTLSDFDGNFSINLTSGGTLELSFVGYETQEITNITTSTSSLEVQLEPGMALDEVVVVGYGTQVRRTLTSAISEVDGDQLVRRPVSSIEQALQGQLPGLTVRDRGGSPGNPDISMRVRGITTIGNNNPLFLVDGIEQRIWDINPQDIESITLLKDAASTAIYGSRAANGVILVTTKRGKSGEMRVNLNSTFSVQNTINHPKPMDTRNFMELQQQAWANSGTEYTYTPEYIDEYLAGMQSDPLRYPEAIPDWYDIVFSPAPQYDATLSVNGGNEIIRTNASLRYQDQQGMHATSGFKLYDFRINNNIKLGSRINVRADASYRNTFTEMPYSTFNVYRYLLHGGAILTVPKFPDGTYGLGTAGHNPLMYAEQLGYQRYYDNLFNGSVNAELEIINGLKFSTLLGVKSRFNSGKSFRNEFIVTDYFDPSRVLKTVSPNRLFETKSTDIEYTLNNLLTYDVSVADRHNIGALLGYSEIGTTNSVIGASRENFYNNDIQSINAGANDETRGNSGRDRESGLRSFFGRFNYNFEEKYMFELNGRYDGSSNFSRENQYAFFPSVSAAWRISEENFWGEGRTFSDLKIRGSWGETGNQAIPAYEFYPSMSLLDYTFGGNPAQGYILNSFVNEDLTWEVTTQTNIGLDAEFWRGKLTFSADYYEKITNDILLVLPIPTVIGQNPTFQNAGSIENKGWEFQTRYRGQMGDFSYSVSGNFNINKNKVLDLAGTGPYLSGSQTDNIGVTIRQVGLPMNAHWGYLTDGLFQTEEEISNSAVYRANTQPGDTKYVDLNGDGQITPDDMTFLGNNFPEQTYGANIDMNYKGFGLNLLFQGAAKFKTRLGGALIVNGNFEGFVHENMVGNYWTPENTDAIYPRPLKYDLTNYLVQDSFLLDGDYLKLKNVQLSYTLPGGVAERIGASRINISASVTNVFTISELNKWQLDPEVRGGRVDDHPQTSVKSLGLNLQF